MPTTKILNNIYQNRKSIFFSELEVSIWIYTHLFPPGNILKREPKSGGEKFGSAVNLLKRPTKFKVYSHEGGGGFICLLAENLKIAIAIARVSLWIIIIDRYWVCTLQTLYLFFNCYFLCDALILICCSSLSFSLLWVNLKLFQWTFSLWCLNLKLFQLSFFCDFVILINPNPRGQGP